MLLADEFANPLAHFLRSLVGEGDRHDVARIHALLEHVRDAIRHRARLSGAGACQNEDRSLDLRGRLTLGGVEAFENGGDGCQGGRSINRFGGR